MTILFGMFQLDQAIVMAGTALAIGSAIVTWGMAQRVKLAAAELLRVSAASDERRRQELLDFELRSKIAGLEHAAKAAEARVDLLASTTASAAAAAAAAAAVSTTGNRAGRVPEADTRPAV